MLSSQSPPIQHTSWRSIPMSLTTAIEPTNAAHHNSRPLSQSIHRFLDHRQAPKDYQSDSRSCNICASDRPHCFCMYARLFAPRNLTRNYSEIDASHTVTRSSEKVNPQRCRQATSIVRSSLNHCQTTAKKCVNELNMYKR